MVSYCPKMWPTNQIGDFIPGEGYQINCTPKF